MKSNNNLIILSEVAIFGIGKCFVYLDFHGSLIVKCINYTKEIALRSSIHLIDLILMFTFQGSFSTMDSFSMNLHEKCMIRINHKVVSFK